MGYCSIEALENLGMITWFNLLTMLRKGGKPT